MNQNEKVSRMGMNERLMRAFNSESVVEKNLAIRAAFDFIAAMLVDDGWTETAIAAMPVQAEPVAWHSPLGGLIEARQIAQQAYKDIEREKSINGHIAGNPYDVALSALNSVLGCLAVLVDPTPPNGGSDAE